MFTSGQKAFLNNLNKYESLGRKPKDTIVIADSRELAEEIKQNMIDEAELVLSAGGVEIIPAQWKIVSVLDQMAEVIMQLKVLITQNMLTGGIEKMEKDLLTQQ